MIEHYSRTEEAACSQAGAARNSGVVLAPVDFSEPVEETLGPASRLALGRGWSVALLHVVRLKIAGEEIGIPRARLVRELAREAEERLREAARSARWGVPVETLVGEGRPGPGIVEQASRLRPAVIVMRGALRRRWFDRWRGNDALYVARRAPCPVWLLPKGRARGPFAPVLIESGALEAALGFQPGRPAANLAA